MHYIEINEPITKERDATGNRKIRLSVVVPEELFMNYLQEQLNEKPLYVSFQKKRFYSAKPFIHTEKLDGATLLEINTPIEVSFPRTLLVKNPKLIEVRLVDLLLVWLSTAHSNFQKDWSSKIQRNQTT